MNWFRNYTKCLNSRAVAVFCKVGFSAIGRSHSDSHHNLTLLGSLIFTPSNHLPQLIKVTDLFGKHGDDVHIEFNRTAMNPVQLLPGAICEILASVTETGVLTLADRYGLMAATFDESLNDEDRSCVNRLLRAVLRGRVKMVNELSAAF